MEKGADANLATEDGYSPIFIAANNGHAEVVKLLVEKGADLNQANVRHRTSIVISVLAAVFPLLTDSLTLPPLLSARHVVPCLLLS